MSKTKRLNMYKAVLHDWEQPVSEDNEDTHMGFCYYFWVNFAQELYNEDFEREYPELYAQRIIHGEGGYHYDDMGYTELGRKQRVVALKKAIKLLS
jgi:hypothetical protein